MPDDEFRTSYPSAGGAYLLDAEADNVGAVLAAVRGSDPMKTRRHALQFYFLGPDEPDRWTRFEKAVDRAICMSKESSAN